MADDVSSPVTLKAPGRKIEQPALPSALSTRSRGSSAADDVFLPSGYVRAVEAIDLSPAARAVSGTEQLNARPGQVVCIELSDGVTVFTSPEKLRETLARVAPDAAKNGVLELDALARRDVVTRSAGAGAGNVFARITTLDVGGFSDAILDLARDKLREYLHGRLADYAELGVSWLGTKALLWAVESQLAQRPGLYRWVPAQGKAAQLLAVDAARLAAEAQAGPLLLFIHGTGSSTAGSYTELRELSPEYWRGFEASFGERVFAFEHRTMSESPIENALALVSQLPKGARIHLVTHSRGGLVGDLLCLTQLHGADRALVDAYDVDQLALGELEGEEREETRAELMMAYAEHRAKLRELGALLADKQLRVERYVRVACPARGTRLASGNIDVFLSALLSLTGLVPALAASPVYAAFKRVLLEIVRNRTRPALVPGIEAMLPESPLARLLATATPQPAAKMAVIAGDIEGGGLFKRLGALFTDHVFFDGADNDLVVDTDSMYAGVAPKQNARALFDRGPEVSHFRYFTNDETRIALRRWLVDSDVDAIPSFAVLPKPGQDLPPRTAARRSAEACTLPVVVVLPGVMGSHLRQGQKQRIWFDFAQLALGGLKNIAYAQKGIEAEQLFGLFYGDLCEHLAKTHQVEPFAYDWRLPLDQLADALAQRLRRLLDETSAQGGGKQRPIRLLAHSMGGLVVRALAHKHRALWDELMARDQARFVMLGTPNHGSHAMVENLIGKADIVRMLARLDLKNDLQSVLDVLGEFRGALQLLPRTGFDDTARARVGDYFDPAVWQRFKREVRDLWFGDGVVATPSAAVLTQARWLWDQGDLPPVHAAKTYYVHGWARNTPCGIKQIDGRWKMLATPRGDGTVTWDSGKLASIAAEHYSWMPVEHGAMADARRYFDSLALLLARGERGDLLAHEPARRDGAGAEPIDYEAGPPVFPTELDLAAGLLGRARPPTRVRTRAVPTLKVKVRAGDLRFVPRPIMVGHYERDAISGAEALIDGVLSGALTMRYDLGMYAGPLGTATVVLPARNELERARGSYRGAVVAGLGKYDGSLNIASLTEAVRTAALRYLLQRVDLGEGEPEQEPHSVPLASLLLGYDSSANLGVGEAVTALVRGVAQANRKFAEITRSRALYIGELELVEMYLDTAISAAHALKKAERALNEDSSLGCKVECAPELVYDEGWRHRLEDRRSASHWSRAVITSDDCGDASAPAARPSTSIAKRMRFLYLGQRARAETVMQQRQPGMVETLVAQQLHITRYRSEFSRALFQLLVPHEFKDAVRQIDRVVLVLDKYTANLPWELLAADELADGGQEVKGKLPLPLCIKGPLVRQLSASSFRTQIKQSQQRRAFVVGNPSSLGFAAAFSLANELSPLPAAEKEALTVSGVLTHHGYSVEQSIGEDQTALDVITRLYQGPYRLLHIAAHGVFEQLHVDGTTRSGVVLSGGLLITAAEVGAMEIVPDLVFLNCCHLGLVNATPQSANRLAASLACELIEMGVRAVVVAGWAVDDEPANRFAETFYRSLLTDRNTFGDAVFEARKAVYEPIEGSSITWGAYQAYGDPAFRLEPKPEVSWDHSLPDDLRFVAPDELLGRIERARANLRREQGGRNEAQLKRYVDHVEALCKKAPAAWLERGDVCSAVGVYYGDLGARYFPTAQTWLSKAVANGDKEGRASFAAIELLANFESRTGAELGDRAQVKRAIERLTALTRLSAVEPGRDPEDKSLTHHERAGLLGSAYKRLATLCARAYFETDDAAQRQALASEMDDALAHSADWYAAPSKGETVDAYTQVNWLFLMTLQRDAVRDTMVSMAQKCAARANAGFQDNPDFWSAITAVDAYLVQSIFDDSLRMPARATARREELERKYAAAQFGLVVKPRDLDSVAQQIELMACFFDVRAAQDPADTGAVCVRDSLRSLVDSFDPAVRPKRPDGAPTRSVRDAEPTAAPSPKPTQKRSPRPRPRMPKKSAK